MFEFKRLVCGTEIDTPQYSTLQKHEKTLLKYILLLYQQIAYLNHNMKSPLFCYTLHDSFSTQDFFYSAINENLFDTIYGEDEHLAKSLQSKSTPLIRDIQQ